MKIVLINSVNFGSTGNIAADLASYAQKQGHDVYLACANSRTNKQKNIERQIFIGNPIERRLHLLFAQLTGYNGCFSHIGTWFFLRKLDFIHPNIIHLHNLHNCYINLPMLFRYIKMKKISILWTLHDCWAFTGQCPHFQISGCNKWKSGCYQCQQYKEYPASVVDRTGIMYRLKKKWFTGVEKLTIVTPSKWLCELVKQSFLKDYDIEVINNGIDLNIFMPANGALREKLGLNNKFVIMGCASPWSRRKGLDVFIKLSAMLEDSYKIILVGISDEQKKNLPDNIIAVGRTSNKEELAQYYSMADVFVNPTLEENYPTVNMEALACGTPVLTFRTGGSPEIIDETCGRTVECNDIEALIKEISSICEGEAFSSINCLRRAKNFDKIECLKKYVDLYNAVEGEI